MDHFWVRSHVSAQSIIALGGNSVDSVHIGGGAFTETIPVGYSSCIIECLGAGGSGGGSSTGAGGGGGSSGSYCRTLVSVAGHAGQTFTGVAGATTGLNANGTASTCVTGTGPTITSMSATGGNKGTAAVTTTPGTGGTAPSNATGGTQANTAGNAGSNGTVGGGGAGATALATLYNTVNTGGYSAGGTGGTPPAGSASNLFTTGIVNFHYF